MIPTNRSASAFGYRSRQPPVGNRMVSVAKLGSESVTLSGSEGDQPFRVTAKRGAGGKLWLTCSCPRADRDGWCNHEIDLLCGRYDAVSTPDQSSRETFVEIVGGTSVSDAGQALDRATRAFDDCVKVFDQRRPRDTTGRNLSKFADLITDLAACAAELEEAAGGFRRLLGQA